MPEAILSNHPHVKNLTNKTFGRLTVISFAGSRTDRKPYRAMWNCNCQCGASAVVAGSNLTRGVTRSCGCFCKDRVSESHTIHGHYGTPTYNVWSNILERCNNPNHKAYNNYGGRGIKVCEQWRFSYLNFLRDVGERPSLQHSIDRFPNNDGDYEPGNVRWATVKQQGRNRRTNRMITINGETKCLIEWREHFQISEGAVFKRLRKGMSIEDALTTPIKKR